MSGLAGKIALVTGAGSGIGEAIARRLATDGATVAALDLLPDRAAAVADAIIAKGGAAFPLVADVAEEAPMRAAFAELANRAGRLDIVVANAGINGHWAPIDELTPEQWDVTTRTNLRGTYLTMHLAVPMLKAAGGGAVVIVASINGARIATTAGATAYSAAKAGQVAIARQLALELGRHGIRVNAVLPGMTETNIRENTWRHNAEAAGWPVHFPDGDIPLTAGRAADPGDIAAAIAMLVGDDARHVTGAELTVDGGQSLLR